MKELAKNDMIGVKLVLRDLQDKHKGSMMPALEVTKDVLKTGLKIYRIAEEFDKRTVVTIISFLMQDYCKQFNVSKNMTASQCNDYALELLADELEKPKGQQLSIEEFAIFFDRAKSGVYGVPFDRIDRGVIGPMLEKYFEEDRTKATHAVYEERDNEFKRNTIPVERSTPQMGISQIETKYNPQSASNIQIPGITHGKIYKNDDKNS